MPHINVNNLEINYQTYGSDFPVILITGLAGDLNWWSLENIKYYARYFKIIIFDNRGAGLSSNPKKEYTIENLTEDVVELLDALKIEKTHILGTSMGGMIAQEIAINHPEYVEKLILCSTHCGGTKKINPSQEVLKILTSSEHSLAEGVISLCFTDEIKRNHSFIESFKMKIQKTPIDPKSYIYQLRAVEMFDSYSKLELIKAPTLILHGKEDVLVPFENSHILNKLIPKSKMIILDHLGHWIFEPNSKDVNKIVINFLLN